MYNRYIRNDRGIYTRITEDDGPPSERTEAESDGPPPHGPPSETAQAQSDGPPRNPPPETSEPRPHRPPPRNPPPQASGPPRSPHGPPSGPPNQDPLSGFLRQFVDFSALERLDAGDLLLLGLLFLLYREGADEETVLALGLLLIL